MGLSVRLALAGILCMPVFAWSESLPDCANALQTGLQKSTFRNTLGWSATAKEEVLSSNLDSVALAREKAETNSLLLLSSALKNNADKKIKTVIGAKVVQACVYKNFVYVQTWVDDVSMQQAQAMKSDMNNSLANNPTPRNANTMPGSKDAGSTSELENMVKEMQRSHN
jgi:hypothetical protein